MNQKFSSLDRRARCVWAKSDEKSGHGILAHLLDVAAVAETILLRESQSARWWAADALGFSEPQVVRWVACLVGLHDFGKAIPGFQAKWGAGRQADQQAGLSFPPSACKMDRHDLATANLLGKPLQEITNGALDWVRHAVQAISAHHGYHFLSSEVNGGKPEREPGEWSQARQKILHMYWHVLAPQGVPTQEELTLPAVNWLAGLTSAADWIASNPEWFPLGERRDDLQTYYEDAKCLAAKALNAIGWRPVSVLLHDDQSAAVLLKRIVGRDDLSLRPLQMVGDALLQQARGPSLLLVEAPMGEGKTELAFLAYLRLQAMNEHRGLYMALPTQATGNAMFKRALTFLNNFMEGGAEVQLVHGGAAMNVDVQHLRDINHDEAESRAASLWFSQRRRPLLSPYGARPFPG